MFPLFVKRLLGLIICLSILTWFSSLGRIATPSAQCNDGSYSYAQNSRGALVHGMGASPSGTGLTRTTIDDFTFGRSVRI